MQARTTLTRKGQVTIPVEMRRALGLKEGDKVLFTMEDGIVRMARTGSVAEWTKGMFRSGQPPSTAEELREQAEIAIAEEAEKRGR